MYKILLVTHGELAEALKNTLKMFSSDVDHIHTVSLTEGGVESFKESLIKKMEEIYVEGEEVLVLADLFGGTPFNTALVECYGKYKNIKVVAGVNLPILIEAALMKEMDVEFVANSLTTSGKESIKAFEEIAMVSDEDDE